MPREPVQRWFMEWYSFGIQLFRQHPTHSPAGMSSKRNNSDNLGVERSLEQNYLLEKKDSENGTGASGTSSETVHGVVHIWDTVIPSAFVSMTMRLSSRDE